jgi:hypothetical protein
LFADGRRKESSEVNEQELYEQIGRLQMELAWLKKKLPRSSSVKRQWIEPEHRELSIRCQCELLDPERSTYYYQPVPEAPENLAIMRAIDEEYLWHPFYGSRRLAQELGSQSEACAASDADHGFGSETLPVTRRPPLPPAERVRALHPSGPRTASRYHHGAELDGGGDRCSPARYA